MTVVVQRYQGASVTSESLIEMILLMIYTSEIKENGGGFVAYSPRVLITVRVVGVRGLPEL
jgi:hypothetical protein